MLDDSEKTPLHVACVNETVNLEVFKLLFNAWPEAIQIGDSDGGNDGWLPIHSLCGSHAKSVEVLKYMLSIDRTLARERREGDLPIDLCHDKSFDFYKELIDAYPEYLRIRNGGSLLIHEACRYGWSYPGG